MTKTAKNGFKCFKMHSKCIFPKKGNKWQNMVKNGNKCQKITNNCKISEITKYGAKMTTIYKNVKTCKTGNVSLAAILV